MSIMPLMASDNAVWGHAFEKKSAHWCGYEMARRILWRENGIKMILNVANKSKNTSQNTRAVTFQWFPCSRVVKVRALINSIFIGPQEWLWPKIRSIVIQTCKSSTGQVCKREWRDLRQTAFYIKSGNKRWKRGFTNKGKSIQKISTHSYTSSCVLKLNKDATIYKPLNYMKHFTMILSWRP